MIRVCFVYMGTYLACDIAVINVDTFCLQNIEVLMHKCLEFASSQGYSTVAFPAFGTGILKYPADVVAGQMFCSVPKFKLQMPTSSLKEVLFVIYPQNKPTLTVT